MRKTVFIFLVCLSTFLLVLRLSLKPLRDYLSVPARAGIRVESIPPALVLLDNQEAGKSPVQKEDLAAGDHLIEIKGEAMGWKGYVKLNPGTLTVVNRELNKEPSLQSGEVISLEKGQGIAVLSNPTGADVEIDGNLRGRTPLSLPDLSSGEHQFMITKGSFTTRSIRSVMTDGYRLNLVVDLAVSDIDVTKLEAVPIQSTPQIRVLQTPTGFLRVRAQASVNSQEVGRVVPGDKLPLLEELPSWKKVRLADGKEGYVSSQYVEKLTP